MDSERFSAAVDRTKERLAKIVDKYKPENKAPELCHYCTFEAGRAIVTDHNMWLTNAEYCNDEDELRIAYELALATVDDRLKQCTPFSPNESNLQSLRALIAPCQRDPVYVCCFAENDDLLSQWRAYGGDGFGVCLRFERDKVERLADARSRLRLQKVIYSKQVHETIVQEIVDLVETSQHQPFEGKAMLDVVAPLFKSRAFAEEQEWRLIHVAGPGTQISFRCSGSLFAPYVQLKHVPPAQSAPNAFETGEFAGVNASANPIQLPISGAKVGPGRHAALNTASFSQLFHANGYQNFKVEKSAAPYRGR